MVAATAAIFPRDRPVVDDDFASVGGDHYNVVFDYATMATAASTWWSTCATVGGGCHVVAGDNYTTTAGCLDNFSAQLRHHGRRLGRLQCRLRVGRRQRR